MINLLTETKGILKKHNKYGKDVLWVGHRNDWYPKRTQQYLSWKNFVKIANIEYDDGFGGNKIDMDLVIVGNNWWLERHEYDGSEWWEYKELPKKPNCKASLKTFNLFHK